MELTERKRSRKSQSFKLVNQDYEDVYKGHENSNDVNGEHTLASSLVGDEGLEIKKQVTGMRRLLNDSTGRIYQRVGEEGENIKEAPQDSDVAWGHPLNPSPETIQSVHPPQRATWSSSSQMGLFPAQYGTRSKDNHVLMKTSEASNGEISQINALAGSKCCTCNCQPTLQAILEELKAIRKCVQLQAGSQIKQQPSFSSVCASRSTLSRKRMKKRKLPLRIVPPIGATQKPHLEKQERRQLRISGMPTLTRTQPNIKAENDASRVGIIKETFASDPEVQLAEGFDVLMPKSQLDSILANYTRSGSLLFRKLVCAFFDDQTLANSLPNGKRKRGLNDNRKGLDHNIVGAIKVFTEKYCSANRIDKVPGSRDWVQILQDQIKLARRRLKRGTDSGNCPQSNTEQMWMTQKQEYSM